MKMVPITRDRVDELLRFLPRLGKPGESLDPEWRGLDATPDKDRVLTLPYPTYPPVVEEFFQLASQPCWSDYGYKPEAADKLVHSDEAIASASLGEIKTMLTFCVRGERFCDGHWGAMVNGGRIRAILRRLEQLRESVK